MAVASTTASAHLVCAASDDEVPLLETITRHISKTLPAKAQEFIRGANGPEIPAEQPAARSGLGRDGHTFSDAERLERVDDLASMVITLRNMGLHAAPGKEGAVWLEAASNLYRNTEGTYLTTVGLLRSASRALGCEQEVDKQIHATREALSHHLTEGRALFAKAQETEARIARKTALLRELTLKDAEREGVRPEPDLHQDALRELENDVLSVVKQIASLDVGGAALERILAKDQGAWRSEWATVKSTGPMKAVQLRLRRLKHLSSSYLKAQSLEMLIAHSGAKDARDMLALHDVAIKLQASEESDPDFKAVVSRVAMLDARAQAHVVASIQNDMPQIMEREVPIAIDIRRRVASNIKILHELGHESAADFEKQLARTVESENAAA